MAITDGMLVRVGSQRYILPTVNINMSFARCGGVVYDRRQGEIVLFQGKLMPIFRLHRLFASEGLSRIRPRASDHHWEGDQRCALLVDELVGQQQVVAKSLGAGIGKIEGFPAEPFSAMVVLD